MSPSSRDRPRAQDTPEIALAGVSSSAGENENQVSSAEETIEINLNSGEDPQIVLIGQNLDENERHHLVELLKLNKYIFAWFYKSMSDIDPKIVQHQWVVNVVPVAKKDGKIRVFVNYSDLNKASPKDNFPLPHIDVLVDHAAGHELLSFMDGFSSYNQVLMASKDKEKITFIIEVDTFCYRVMPFGLKNAGATYQRAVTTILHDMIHKEVEVYVDDMIVKFRNQAGHIRGIEVDPSKIAAITAMPTPRNEREVRGFLGKIQYISLFISKLTSTCDPLFKLLKKDQRFIWSDACQHAFDKVKAYLQSPPILMSPRPGVPLILYLTVTESSMGSMLAQENENKEEVAVYYLSKRMTSYELNYSSVEKVCWALAWVTKRLRHYMQAHPIKLVSRLDPIRFLFQRTLLSLRLAKWMMMISEYDITYTVQKSIKGSIVADFLADQPITVGDDDEEMAFPDDEIMGRQGYDIGILLIDPTGTYNPTSVKLSYSVTNNEAEYEACIVGIKLASEKRISRLEVIGDSNLVISQANGDWQVKGDNLKPYHSFLMRLIAKFESVVFIHAPRSQNHFADALATLAAMTQIPEGIKIKPLKIQQRCNRIYEKLVVANTSISSKPWFEPIQSYIERGEYPAHFQKKERRALRQFATSYVVVAGRLYRRSFDGQNMLCVDQAESTTIMEEVHAGNCGSHMNGMALAKKVLRLGYFWQNLEQDCIAFVKTCHQCQIYANLKHTPASHLYNMTSPWPFSTWGIDIIGKIHPHASNGHEFISVAIDYFTKWVEASSFKILKSSHVAKFIRNNIISRYGVPHSMISDNGRHFQGNVLELLREFKIEHHKSSPYRPQTNGAVEAANKNVISILKKTTQTYRDWHEKLPYALWGYRTTAWTSTGETPYSLVYGMEAVQPIELELPTLRVLLESHVIEEDWLKSRYDQLSLMEDRRLDALCKTQAYQQRMARAFNKKVKPRHLVVGDLVLRKTRELQDPRGKFQPPWEGPFIIKQIFSGGAVRLATLDGDECSSPFNLDTLKKYYS
ncbi:uncharacterized protein LOC124917607 [Impatiens glandulifera]|uniref:uncharacterized protein LOC124917607 n=1 Tax=Impatiens glandulifera TaxID=253017 RepID=UPI001FB135EF|nr:uncharacterized protein LOC124917607 [Impatiens glandulifera]